MSRESEFQALLGEADGHRIRLLKQPHKITLRYLQQHPFVPIFSYGIVNPYGPSLQTVVVVRDGTSAPLTVVAALLHPFVPELKLIGHISRAAPGVRAFERDLTTAIDHAELHFGSSATLLLQSEVLRFDQTMQVAYDMLLRQADVANRLALHRQFPNDPWSRVGFEVGNIEPDKANVDAPHVPEGQEACAAELVKALFSLEHTEAELGAFVDAWNGSIKFQQDKRELPPEHLSFEAIRPIFSRLIESHIRAANGDIAAPLDS